MSIFFTILCFILCILLPGIFLLISLLSWETPSFRLIYKTLWRDVRAGYRFLRVSIFLKYCHANNLSVGKLFQKLVEKHPNKLCFLYEDQKWTFQQVEDYSNQIANAFTAAGYQKGDEVSVVMENRPEYACIWLGLSKIGIIPGLINTNLRQQSLAHTINVINSKAIIFNAELATAVKDVIPYLEERKGMEYLCLGTLDNNNFDSFHVKSFESFIQDSSKNPPKDIGIGFQDKLFYIFTSGTTGLPKAAIIRHSRFVWICAAAKHVMKLKEDDIYYNSLPMYHSSGGMMFLSVVLIFSGTMVVRKKFSASNFWKDAIKYKATVAIYIGEICRFLYNQPKKAEETKHSIRLMAGNGLRPQIWEDFQKRFNVANIIELYGSTEGNANVVNMFGKVGAVGFLTRLFPRIYPVHLIKVDPDTAEPIRDENGLCIRCKAGEPGAMVGKIIENNPVNQFDGYANKEATRKKMIRNCFTKGDLAFHSGDIMTMDEEGYLYFMDRTGDTFRWKGENVSTVEVEMIISKALNLIPCVVYGVQIPGNEGKAGMVAIECNNGPMDMNSLYKTIASSLPKYAIPIFIRLCLKIDSTGTYKLRKVEFQKENYDPTKVSDPIFMLNLQTQSYERLDENKFNQITKGEIKL